VGSSMGGSSLPSHYVGTDLNDQMNAALNQQLMGANDKEIHPTLNYFRTEEKLNEVKKFQSFENVSKEDAILIFKECLRDMGVSTSWKWEDANRVVQNDPRVKALRTISERKQAFNDFINEMKTRERNDAKQRRQQQREGFQDLLKEQKQLHSLSKQYQMFRTLMCDSRFKNIEDKDREEIF